MKLIIRVPNWVGDAVMAFPAISSLTGLDKFPETTIAARPTVASLFESHPALSSVLRIEDKKSYAAAIGAVRSDRFDCGIVLPPSFSSALLFYLGGVKRRIGYKSDSRSWLLSDAVPLPEETLHRSELYRRLIASALQIDLPDSTTKLAIKKADRETARALLTSAGIDDLENYAAIAPQAVAESRRWGVEKYSALAGRIVSQLHMPVVLLGTTSDRIVANHVVEAYPKRVVNLCGETTLMQAAAILAGAQIFIGNDSGLAHLAGAAGSPLVVLSGADNPVETSPRATNKQVIIKDLDCISCVKNKCPLGGDDYMQCMKQITVDEVFEAVNGLITA